MGCKSKICKTDPNLQEPDGFEDALCLYLNSLSKPEKEELLGYLQFGKSLPKNKEKYSV